MTEWSRSYFAFALTVSVFFTSINVNNVKNVSHLDLIEYLQRLNA